MNGTVELNFYVWLKLLRWQLLFLIVNFMDSICSSFVTWWASFVYFKPAASNNLFLMIIFSRQKTAICFSCWISEILPGVQFPYWIDLFVYLASLERFLVDIMASHQTATATDGKMFVPWINLHHPTLHPIWEGKEILIFLIMEESPFVTFHVACAQKLLKS